MGIEEDFYATLKLKSGEEIFAKIAATEEENRTLLIVSNPVVVSEIKGRTGIAGYKIEGTFPFTVNRYEVHHPGIRK